MFPSLVDERLPFVECSFERHFIVLSHPRLPGIILSQYGNHPFHGFSQRLIVVSLVDASYLFLTVFLQSFRCIVARTDASDHEVADNQVYPFKSLALHVQSKPFVPIGIYPETFIVGTVEHNLRLYQHGLMAHVVVEEVCQVCHFGYISLYGLAILENQHPASVYDIGVKVFLENPLQHVIAVERIS